MLKNVRAFAQKLRANEHGATAIEYGLIAAIIAIAIVVSITLVSGELQNTFQGIGDAFNTILG